MYWKNSVYWDVGRLKRCMSAYWGKMSLFRLMEKPVMKQKGHGIEFLGTEAVITPPLPSESGTLDRSFRDQVFWASLVALW